MRRSKPSFHELYRWMSAESDVPLLLSFDIGTRHLAYCALALARQGNVLSAAPIVKHWAVVDLMAVPDTPYSEAATHTCVKHWKMPQLRQWLEDRQLNSAGKRVELQVRITKHLVDNGVPKVAPNNPCLLATQLHAYLDSQPWMLQCSHVVLENQPCLTNPVMKSVQLIIFGYFMYRGVWCEYARQKQSGAQEFMLPKVSLVSASNKLKAEMTGLVNDTPEPKVKGGIKGKDKAAYKQRKHDAIQLMHTLLQEWSQDDAATYEPWLQHFSSRCKKEQDDLSDCLLQGLYVLRKPIIEASKKANKTAITISKRAHKAALKAAKAAAIAVRKSKKSNL